MSDPLQVFHSASYLEHNAARLDHLARMLHDIGLDPSGLSVLEVGAGVGDHSGFWIEHGARVTITDSRPQNIEIVKTRHPGATVSVLDLDDLDGQDLGSFDIVYAFGVLYHLARPGEALAALAGACRSYLFLETCVSLGEEAAINPVAEPSANPSQASSGLGCRPTRTWVFETLRAGFEHVYQPSYQPDHEQFLEDWTDRDVAPSRLMRTTFVATRAPISSPYYFPRVLDAQVRRPKTATPAAAKGLDAWLSRQTWGVVLDVGANQGQFAQKIRRLGHRGRIVCFEPLPAAADRLEAWAAKDGRVTVRRLALGACDETSLLHIAGNSASSSLLEIEAATVAAEPMTRYVGAERVEVRRLDALWPELFASAPLAGPVLLKLDVQGAERAVIDGLGARIDQIDAVLMECSLVSVYRGEPLIEEQIALLRSLGFDPVSIDLGWSDRATGATYQVDVLFQRRT